MLRRFCLYLQSTTRTTSVWIICCYRSSWSILFFLIGAGVAGYVAYGLRSPAGCRASTENRNGKKALRLGAEDQESARIVAEAEAQARQLQLAIKEEEVQRRKEMDAEAARRRAEVEKIEERLQNRLDTRGAAACNRSTSRERKINQRETKITERETQV
jgi:hypothetical protein